MMRKYYILIGVICFLFVSAQAQEQSVVASIDTSLKVVHKVELSGVFCAVKVTKSSSDKVVVQGVLKTGQNKDQYRFNLSSTAEVMSLLVESPAKFSSHWGEINLAIPEGMKLSVQTQSGSVTIDQLRADSVTIISKSGHVKLSRTQGVFSVNTPSGNISINKCLGSYKGKSKSGTIRLSEVDGDMDVNTNKGSVVVNDVKGNLIAETSSGSHEIDNSKATIKVKTTSGAMNISKLDGDMNITSFTGNIKIFQTTGGITLKSSTGNVTGNRIKFTKSSKFVTTEGSVKVQMAMEDKSQLAFVLKSNSSYLRAMGKSKKKSLKAGKGSIVIEGISTTGGQTYY
ncbi:DUF4097 domain-containing protein [bacterium]|nr:DUF4097 domain-containing protein [bacterium]